MADPPGTILYRGLLMRKTILLFTVLLWSTSFAAWHPVETPIRTRWARDVTPRNVWQEYPRPQMERSQWKSLNGLWDFTVTDMGASSPPYYDRKILVPFAIEAPLSGIGEQVSEGGCPADSWRLLGYSMSS